MRKILLTWILCMLMVVSSGVVSGVTLLEALGGGDSSDQGTETGDKYFALFIQGDANSPVEVVRGADLEAAIRGYTDNTDFQQRLDGQEVTQDEFDMQGDRDTSNDLRLERTGQRIRLVQTIGDLHREWTDAGVTERSVTRTGLPDSLGVGSDPPLQQSVELGTPIATPGVLSSIVVTPGILAKTSVSAEDYRNSAAARSQALQELGSDFTFSGDYSTFIIGNTLYTDNGQQEIGNLPDNARSFLVDTIRLENIKGIENGVIQLEIPGPLQSTALRFQDGTWIGLRTEVDPISLQPTTVETRLVEQISVSGSDRPAEIDFAEELIRTTTGEEIPLPIGVRPTGDTLDRLRDLLAQGYKPSIAPSGVLQLERERTFVTIDEQNTIRTFTTRGNPGSLEFTRTIEVSGSKTVITGKGAGTEIPDNAEVVFTNSQGQEVKLSGEVLNQIERFESTPQNVRAIGTDLLSAAAELGIDSLTGIEGRFGETITTSQGITFSQGLPVGGTEYYIQDNRGQLIGRLDQDSLTIASVGNIVFGDSTGALLFTEDQGFAEVLERDPETGVYELRHAISQEKGQNRHKFEYNERSVTISRDGGNGYENPITFTEVDCTNPTASGACYNVGGHEIRFGFAIGSLFQDTISNPLTGTAKEYFDSGAFRRAVDAQRERLDSTTSYAEGKRGSLASQQTRSLFRAAQDILTSSRGYAGYSSLFLDEEFLTEWKAGVEEAFASSYLGTEYWTSAICESYSDTVTPGVLYSDSPNGLLSVAAYVAAQQLQGGVNELGETEFVYKIEARIENGFNEGDPAAVDQMRVNVELRGASTEKLLEADEVLEKGDSFRKTGTGAIILESTDFFTKVCITFDRAPSKWRNDGNEICNTVVAAGTTPSS